MIEFILKYLKIKKRKDLNEEIEKLQKDLHKANIYIKILEKIIEDYGSKANHQH